MRPPIPLTAAFTIALLAAAPVRSAAQHLSSARATALGAYTAVSEDLSALDWNPAGLTGVRDWKLSAANFFQSRDGSGTFTFHDAAAGKLFLPGHATATRFSPGISLDFVVPSTFTVEDSASSIVTESGREISYSEQFAVGYAYSAGGGVSLGISAHFFEEKVSDTEYSIDSNNVISASPVGYRANSWTVDWGALWEPSRNLRLGAVAKNLFRITESSLPEEAGAPPLELSKTLRGGGAYTGVPRLLLTADADTRKQLRAGALWSAAGFLDVMGGAYVNADGGFTAEAFGAGLAVTVGNVSMAAGALLFTDGTGRDGSAGLDEFEESGIEGIEYNAFTGDRITFDISVNLGRTRESIARIEYVEVLSDIHPSSAAVYAFRPVGKARVRNVADTPIEATVSFSLGRFTDGPTVGKPQVIAPGEAVEVPFYAVLNGAVLGVRSMTVGEGEVSVSAVKTGDSEDSYPAKVLVRGRNDWDGDVTLLKYFVTPDDPEIVALARGAVAPGPTAGADTADARLRALEEAKAIFGVLSGRLLYVSDPRGSQDNVQYPSETIALKGGDCDDLTVLYCSLLSSVGIRTAFIDVVPPGEPDSAHIFMMFDTGIGPADAGLVSGNPKRYVVRRRPDGTATLWVPVETTLLRKDFAAAWESGANEYYRRSEIEAGLQRGWIRIIDHETDF